jgi:hypothetical protein
MSDINDAKAWLRARAQDLAHLKTLSPDEVTEWLKGASPQWIAGFKALDAMVNELASLRAQKAQAIERSQGVGDAPATQNGQAYVSAPAVIGIGITGILIGAAGGWFGHQYVETKKLEKAEKEPLALEAETA